MSTLGKAIWAAAAILLVLCLRVNSDRSVDGALDCMNPKNPQMITQVGCNSQRSWSVSLKFPWNRW
jgi:hypothetical protein